MASASVKIASKLLHDGRKVRYRRFSQNGSEHYNIRIFIRGSARDLANVKKVIYHLPDGFSRKRRVAYDAEDGFAVEIWTWGVFPLTAELIHDNGLAETIEGEVMYSLPEDSPENYQEYELT